MYHFINGIIKLMVFVTKILGRRLFSPQVKHYERNLYEGEGTEL
jgi:hypothetical protein